MTYQSRNQYLPLIYSWDSGPGKVLHILLFLLFSFGSCFYLFLVVLVTFNEKCFHANLPNQFLAQAKVSFLSILFLLEVIIINVIIIFIVIIIIITTSCYVILILINILITTIMFILTIRILDIF